VVSTGQRDQQEQQVDQGQEQSSSTTLVTSQPTYYTADSSGIITIPIQQAASLGAIQTNPVSLFNFMISITWFANLNFF